MGVQNNQRELYIMMALMDGPNMHDLIFSKKYQVKKATWFNYQLPVYAYSYNAIDKSINQVEHDCAALSSCDFFT